MQSCGLKHQLPLTRSGLTRPQIGLRVGLTARRLRLRTTVTRSQSSPLEIEKGQAEAWLNVAFPHNQGFKDESDSALKEALNEVCNMTLTALLKEDEEEIISITDELYSLGEFFSKQGNRKAAVLMFILYKLCNHQIPEAADTLDGLYKEAYLKIGGMLEDSGWELKHEREEKDDDSPDNTSVSHLSDLQS